MFLTRMPKCNKCVLHLLSAAEMITLVIVLFGLPGVAESSCSLKCGVIETVRGEATLLSFIRNVWSDIQHTRNLWDMTLTFENLERRTDMDWDTFVQAYMDIGNKNVSSIFGPYIQPTVASSERHGIPYFIMDTSTQHLYAPYNLLRVFPDHSEIYKIAVDVAKRYDIKEVVILYEDSYGTQIVEELIQLPSIRVRAYKLSYSVRTEEMMRILLSMRQLLVTTYIVVTSRVLTNNIMNQALHLSMLSSRYTWILPTIHQEENDLTPYAYTEVNLTTFHLTKGDTTIKARSLSPFTEFEYATLYDALLTLYESVKLYFRSFRSCQWSGKNHLLQILHQVDVEGATGHLSYSKDGRRQGYIVNILGFQSTQLTKIGVWNSSKEPENRLQLQFDDEPELIAPSLEYPFGKDVVRVVTVLEEPFVKLTSNHEQKKGNAKFEGYCVDLLQYIAEDLGFEYELYLSPDGEFGSPTGDGSWNGMVRELLNGNASLSVASLTITAQREKVVDFSKPFRPRGLTIMMKKTQKQRSFFQLLDPLSPVVWGLIFAVLVVISFILYIVDRLAQLTNHKDHEFTFAECFWFTFASLLRNGVDYVPRSVPGKIMAGFLWFFALIIVSTYTANLAAFLTISKFDTPIHSVFDLANQAKVKYGTVWNSATRDFFEFNKLDNLQQVWQYMAVVNPSGMVDSHLDGIKMVNESNGDYAFIWDADVIRYEVNKNCDLVEVGQVFDNAKGYGIGTPRGSSYRDDISMAILRLSENGKLFELDQKWWEPPTCPEAEKKKATGTRQALSVESISGVFVVLVAGVVISLFTALVTYFINRKKKKPKHKHEANDVINDLVSRGRNNSRHEKNKIEKYDITMAAPNQTEPFLRIATDNPPSCSKQTNIF